MAAPKRTTAQRERDLEFISRYYLQGLSHLEIRDRLVEAHYPDDGSPISRRTISNDLRTLRERWINSAIRNVDQAIARELAKIDELERTLWEAWERSTRPAKVRTTRTRGELRGGQVVTAEGGIEITTRTADSTGQVKYLTGIARCIQLRTELLGPAGLDIGDAHAAGDGDDSETSGAECG